VRSLGRVGVFLILASFEDNIEAADLCIALQQELALSGASHRARSAVVRLFVIAPRAP
jgi:hypothetical protein